MVIHIQNLEFETIIGILKEEREIPQRVLISLEIQYDYVENRYIDYAEVVSLITKLFQEKKFEVVEDALGISFETLKSAYPVIESIEMSVLKPDIISNARVGVKDKISFRNL